MNTAMNSLKFVFRSFVPKVYSTGTAVIAFNKLISLKKSPD